MKCKICNSTTDCFTKAKVLNQYRVAYYQCKNCGFIQTEAPYWLDLAYSDAIAVADTGIVQRNIAITAKLAALLYFEFDSRSSYLDVAGGYGLLVRLMRDIGFDFYWSDKYAPNLLAREFEAEKAKNPFCAVTAFEVLEHLVAPMAFINEILNRYNSRTLLFTTQLYRGDPPSEDWWYYAFKTGQHIAFYQKKTLMRMAKQLSLKFYSAHGIHMFTDQPVNKRRFYILTSRLAWPIAFYVRRRMKSRTLADHYALMNSVNYYR